jgi:hypothetical protein
MHRIKINWMELEGAFQSASWEMHCYLDLETGRVVTITDEVAGYLEQPPDHDLPDWMSEMLQETEQVEEGYGTRYIQVPEADSHEAYRDMQRFISTVRDDRLCDRLWRAIEGRGAFRYFKDVLSEYPAERDRWFAFQAHREHERISDWLSSEHIEPTNPVAPPEEPEPQTGEEDEAAEEALLEDLTLLVIYLSSWEEQALPDFSIRRAWKGYLFDVLDALEEKGYIGQTRRAKSLTLTEEGVRRAEALRERYAR